jgi:hypothetical protein
VAEDAGEEALGVVAVEDVGVGVAQGGGDDLIFFRVFVLFCKTKKRSRVREIVSSTSFAVSG